MGSNYKNRALIISWPAASGILTCGLALADIFLPAAWQSVLVSIPLLGDWCWAC